MNSILTPDHYRTLVASLVALQPPVLPHPAPLVVKYLLRLLKVFKASTDNAKKSLSVVNASPAQGVPRDSKTLFDLNFCHDLAWEYLHNHPWREVDPHWRTLQSCSCILIALLKAETTDYRGAYRSLDMAAIMGGPVHAGVIAICPSQ